MTASTPTDIKVVSGRFEGIYGILSLNILLGNDDAIKT